MSFLQYFLKYNIFIYIMIGISIIASIYLVLSLLSLQGFKAPDETADIRELKEDLFIKNERDIKNLRMDKERKLQKKQEFEDVLNAPAESKI